MMIFVKKLQKLALAGATATMLFGSGLALAGGTSVLAERIQAVEDAVNAGDAKAWAQVMYADAVVITGEGSEKPIRGLSELMPVLQDITAGTKSCSIDLNEASVNGNQAWSFATWNCTPLEGESYQVRALYVWEKHNADWHVVSEMYGMGSMN